MTRRATTGGKAAKARPHRAAKAKRLARAATAPGSHPPATDLQHQLDQRTRERDEALEREKATAEVLRVISASPGELTRVFESILENATRVCGAKFGVLFRFEDHLFHLAASLDVPPAFADFLDRQGAFAPEPGRLFGKLCETKGVIHVVDRASEP